MLGGRQALIRAASEWPVAQENLLGMYLRQRRTKLDPAALGFPAARRLAFEYSTFAVDGRTDLSLVVYNPATPEDAARSESLIVEKSRALCQDDGRERRI